MYLHRMILPVLCLIFHANQIFAGIEVVESRDNVRVKTTGLRDGEKVFERIQATSQKTASLLIFYWADGPVAKILRESDGGTTITYLKSDVHEVSVSLDEKGDIILIYLLNERGDVLDGAKKKNGVLTPIELDPKEKE